MIEDWTELGHKNNNNNSLFALPCSVPGGVGLSDLFYLFPICTMLLYTLFRLKHLTPWIWYFQHDPNTWWTFSSFLLISITFNLTEPGRMKQDFAKSRRQPICPFCCSVRVSVWPWGRKFMFITRKKKSPNGEKWIKEKKKQKQKPKPFLGRLRSMLQSLVVRANTFFGGALDLNQEFKSKAPQT